MKRRLRKRIVYANRMAVSKAYYPEGSLYEALYEYRKLCQAWGYAVSISRN
jgi:hypothetical protein